MSVNKDRPHILILPEDDANRQLADAFHKKVDWTRYKQMQVLPEVGGWRVVVELFRLDHIIGMERYPERFMILLIDLDGYEDRLEDVKADIPEYLADRVFVLSTLTEPEDLKREGLGSYETIGSVLASECREETYTIQGWDHDLLKHNKSELDRLREHVRPILF
ncbi:MAG TPA: hypothetical protein VLR90_11235 [Blastocatellia bacterium]|nr:hypothetical protein [Blastocatellia bacterium]